MLVELVRLRLRSMAELCEDGDDPLAVARETFTNPPEGVLPIEAVVRTAVVWGDDILVDVQLDPQEYYRQAHSLGEDDLQILADLRDAGYKHLTDLVAWLQTNPDLTIVQLNSTDGELTVDQWPSRPNL